MKQPCPPRRRTALILVPLVVAVTALSSSALAAGDPKALKATADRAVVRERFCDAAYLYRKLDEQKAAPENLIAASDAAVGGGDRAGALRFLETFQSRHAAHRLAGSVAAKVDALRATIAKYGAGAACADPPPECGNGAVEAGEGCDDGNRVDADSCPATCMGGAATTTTAPVVAPVPVPPVKGKVPPVPPVKVEPVKPPPKVEPVKVEPVKVEPVKVEPEPEFVRAPDREPDEEDDVEAADTEEPEEPEATAEAPTTPDEPLREREPEPEPEPAPVPARVVVDEEPVEPVRSIDDAAPPPPSGGSPIAGIALAGVGGLIAVGGGAAVGFGLLPFINYAGNVNKQTAVQQQFLDANTAGERRAAAGAAADLRASLVKDANDWNGLNQWITLGGGIATAAGIGALVGGIILIASSGDAPDEEGGDEDDDKEEEEEENDDAEDDR